MGSIPITRSKPFNDLDDLVRVSQTPWDTGGTLSRDLTRRGLRSRGTRLFEEATDFRVAAVAGLLGHDLYGTDHLCFRCFRDQVLKIRGGALANESCRRE